MKTETLLRHILDMGYEFCTIEQNKVPICRISDCNSPQALVKKLRLVLKQIEPGSYVFILRNKAKGAESTNVYITATIDGANIDNGAGAGAGAGAQYFQAPIDTAKLREEIKAEIKAEQEAKQKEQEYLDRISELEEELKILRSPMERLAGAGMLLLQNTPIGRQLLNMPSVQLNGTNNEDYTDEEDKLIDDAIEIILKYITPKELNRLAKNLEKNPGLIDNLRNFNLL